MFFAHVFSWINNVFLIGLYKLLIHKDLKKIRHKISESKSVTPAILTWA